MIFVLTVKGGTVNHDTHGSPKGGRAERSFSKGRGVQGDKGEIVADIDGSHGWFWRNRGRAPVTIKLTARGDFDNVKQMK